MGPHDPKFVLQRYFSIAHDALVWKLDGLSEYDLRRPLTPTGTNLLGLMKHIAYVELGYFGEVFGRPAAIEIPDDDTPNADMFAAAHESKDDIFELFAAARAHATETIEALALDAKGRVPWWGDAGNPVTLQLILVHMTSEIHRHLGHVDILRETLDGAVGHRDGVSNMPPGDAAYWVDYCDRLEQIALDAKESAE